MLEGISASSGIAIGKALILKENNSEILSKKVDNVQDENERFKLAVEKGKQQLEKTIVKTKEKLGEENQKYLKLIYLC
ncbi:phosphoenolpyruvate-protein phosphotransferase [Clostridium tetanomorphum]|nr:phosphoenolpyruvate-protein phosphotransferase [Clostridium tetanomorphum]